MDTMLTYNTNSKTGPVCGAGQVSKDEFIEGVNIGGAATFLEFAMDSDIQLFI